MCLQHVEAMGRTKPGAQAYIPALKLTCSMTSGKLLGLSEPGPQLEGAPAELRGYYWQRHG